MRLGFIGTGVITEAIVTGLLQSDFPVTEFNLSERNKEISQRLAKQDVRIRICPENQEIVDKSDLLFLAVRPPDAHAVLSPLQYAQGQHVCSLIATLPIDELSRWIGDSARIFRSIPLPHVATLRGVTALYPYDELGEELFTHLGSVVSARTLDEFDAYAVASALMGTYFGVLETASDWLIAQGIDRSSAQSYLNGLFLGLAHTSTASKSKTFMTLRDDHTTSGGLNALVYDVFASSGGQEALIHALDSVAERVRAARNHLPSMKGS